MKNYNYFKKFLYDPDIDPKGYRRVVLTEEDNKVYKVKYFNEKEKKIMNRDWLMKFNQNKYLDMSLVYKQIPKGTHFLYLTDLDKITSINSLDELDKHIQHWALDKKSGKLVKRKRPYIHSEKYPIWTIKYRDDNNEKRGVFINVHAIVGFFTIPLYTDSDCKLEWDHIDQNKMNCHPLNLRLANRSMQRLNQNSDKKGVVYYNITKNKAYFSKNSETDKTISIISSGICRAIRRGSKYLGCEWRVFSEQLFEEESLKKLLSLRDEDFIKSRFYNSKPTPTNMHTGGGRSIYIHKEGYIKIGDGICGRITKGAKDGNRYFIQYWDSQYDINGHSQTARLIASERNNIPIKDTSWEVDHINGNLGDSSFNNLRVVNSKSENMMNPDTRAKKGKASIILDFKKETCLYYLYFLAAGKDLFGVCRDSICKCASGERNYFLMETSTGKKEKCKSMYEEDFLKYLSDLEQTNPKLHKKLFTEYQNCKKSESVRLGLSMDNNME